MTPLRILVADDHEVVRQGVRALLRTRPEWQVCGEAATGREAVEKVKALRPHVVVLDIGMPQLNGLDTTRQILDENPRTEVLILTLHESDEVVRRVLNAGARGYVLKSDAGKHLVNAVEALSRHKPYFSSKVATSLVEHSLLADSSRSTPASVLTPREREIVQLLAEGKSNKEISTALTLSIHTVETHRSNIMHKLGFHSLSDLVRYAVRNTIVDP